MIRLGGRIKRKRENLSMPLSELSRKVGVSISALSQIENAKAFPSVVTLKTIADSLFTTVGDLIGENDTLTKNPLIKSDEIKFVKANSSGTNLFLLSHHESGKQMEPYLLKFTDNRYKISAICTARKLNQGTDIPDVALGIIGARTSSTSDSVQEVGRVARKHKYKDGTWKRGVVINIYIPGTQDERWLKAAQKNPDVIWINSIEDIKFQ